MDGTLLPMNTEMFVETYLGALAEKMSALGLDAKKLIDALWKGTEAMVKNDGSKRNEERFWETFTQLLGDDILQHQADFEDFYSHEFEKARAVTSQNPKVPQIIEWLKAQGIRLVVATNPVFPEVAQKKRIVWAGLEPADFELITTYENSHYCKPNPAYYQEILDKLALRPEEVLMVGNDTTEDTAAMQLGISVFLVTDCLLNPAQIDIAKYPHGDFAAFKAFAEALLPPAAES